VAFIGKLLDRKWYAESEREGKDMQQSDSNWEQLELKGTSIVSAMARASGVDDVTESCRPYIVDGPVVAIFSVTEVSLLREGYR